MRMTGTCLMAWIGPVFQACLDGNAVEAGAKKATPSSVAKTTTVRHGNRLLQLKVNIAEELQRMKHAMNLVKRSIPSKKLCNEMKG